MPTIPPHTRKRSSAWLDHDSTPLLSLTHPSTVDQPSKRLQNSQGDAITTTKPRTHYDAQKLLNNLAFTRFYVTANFGNFSPGRSCILLCLVGEQSGLYRGLCHILPSLYQVSPSLQALAITTGYVSPNATPDQSLQRMLPLLTIVGVESTVVEEFERFRTDLGGAGDRVAAVGPDGVCLYNSAADVVDAQTASDADVARMQAQIVDALTLVAPGGDVTMSNA